MIVADTFGVAAVMLAACGLFLVFLDINPVQAEASPMRLRLGVVWSELAGMAVAEAPRTAVAAAVRAADRFIYYWFEQSERNVATSGGFTLVVFVAVPIAALLNWMRGGSPFLIIVVVACAAGFAMLAVLSETRRAPRIVQALAVLLCTVVLLFMPGYVFVSLTTHTLNTPVAHAALFSILVAPLLYFACQSAVLIASGAAGAPAPSKDAGVARRLATLCLAALPIAYLLVFACLVVGHVAMPEEAVPATWPALLIGMGAGALSAAATLHLARGPRGFGGLVLASAIAVAAAAVVAATASPWLVAVPLTAPLVLWAAAILALLAKVSVSVMGPEHAVRRPYMVAGVSGLVIAAGSSWAAIAL